ncbi:MAG: SgcJ/EcaC family oxidoreductase [Planctomycetaceae bacterium]
MKQLRPLLMLSAACGLIAGWSWYVTAQEPRPRSADPTIVADRSADEQEIRQTAQAFAKAYNAGDAKAIADEFLHDGEYIDEFKNVFKGRDAIEKEMAAFFESSPGNQISIAVEGVRFVGSNMAIEEGVTTLDPADVNEGPAVDSRYVAVHLKQNGKWQIAVARDLESEVPTPHEHLRQIEWLIGEWVDESDEATVRTSTRWSEDGNYILSEFHVEASGVRTMDGSQRIGWDPVAKQIRSWVFDSEGGFAEGAWTKVGDEWLVKANGVRPDGTVASATNVYSPLDGKTIRWSTTQRVIEGELQPDVSVVMVHQPPKAVSESKQ